MPHSSGVETSRHKHMRELRIQHEGRPYRVLYAFDPRRTAVLLIGGDKPATTGGMKNSFRERTRSMISICVNLRRSHMARSFRELQARMDPAVRAANQRRVEQELKRMALEELRKAKQLTQTEVAKILELPQSSVSRIEQRTDLYLSTLRNYIHAMGGVLQIQAIFPDGSVVIDHFSDDERGTYQLWAANRKRRVLSQGTACPARKSAACAQNDQQRRID